MKFGGTSTQDAAAITNVARIVKSRRAHEPVVVISAIAQATNTLERGARLAAEGRAEEARVIIEGLIERHLRIVDECIKDKHSHELLRQVAVTTLARLEELIAGVSVLGELTRRTQDAFCCHGELLSSRIVAAAMQEAGIGTEWIDTKDFMLTDDNFGRSLPVKEIVQERLNAIAMPIMKRGNVPVTQGYIGITPSGRRTTMGRESSDYSAAVIGAALNVDDIQIWTDVDGVLTADPRVVPSPLKVKILSFEQAYELSFFGAKVLHPNTMHPAIEKNIPIHVFNSRHPDKSGTAVTRGGSSHEPVIVSVAYKRNLIIVNIKPKERFGLYAFWENVYNLLTKYALNAHLTVTSEYRLSIVLDPAEQITAAVRDLSNIGHVGVEEHKAILCIVGSHVNDSPHIMNTLLNALSGCVIRLVSAGASSSSVSVLIDDDLVLDAVRRVHADFFGGAYDRDMFEPLDETVVAAS